MHAKDPLREMQGLDHVVWDKREDTNWIEVQCQVINPNLYLTRDAPSKKYMETIESVARKIGELEI